MESVSSASTRPPEWERFFLNMREGVAVHEIIFDCDGSPIDYVITDVNPAFERILGLSPDMVVKKRATEIYGAAPYLDIYQDVAETGNSVYFETHYEPMGRTFEISVFQPYGRGTFATIFGDISERKEQEMAIQRMMRAQTCEYAVSGCLNTCTTRESLVQGVVDTIGSGWPHPEFACAVVTYSGRVYRSQNYQENSVEHQSIALVMNGAVSGRLEVRYLPDHPTPDSGPFAAEEEVLLENIMTRLSLGLTTLESRQLDELTLMSIGDGVITTGVNGCILRMNPVAEMLCGWPLAEAKGRPSTEVFVIINGGTGEPVESPVDRVLREGTIVAIKEGCVLVGRDGQLHDITDSGAPIRLGDTVVGVVLVFTDITAEHATRRELESAHDMVVKQMHEARESQRRHALLESVVQMQSILLADKAPRTSFDGMLNDIMSIIGGKFGAVVELIDDDEMRLIAMQGSTEPFFELLPLQGLYALVAAERKPVIINGSHLSEPTPGLPAATEQFLGIPLLGSEGAIIGILAMGNKPDGYSEEDAAFLEPLVRMLSQAVLVQRLRVEHEEAEEEQKRLIVEVTQARIEAEEASRMKTRFVATMSHEIRTPLNGIIGAADLCMNATRPEDIDEYLDTIHQCGIALCTLVNDVIDFAKIESGMLKLESIPMDLRACFQTALDSVASSACEKGLDVGYVLGEDVPTSIIGDATRMLQILTNLVGNAVKFTERGEVAVTAKMVDGKLHIAVRDTGIGIAPEMQSQLFLPFVQADSSITREFGGSGLGLAISTTMVELMGGRLLLDSTPGEGATFFFEIPVVPVDDDVRGVLPLPQRRVLVIDDSRVVREFISTELSRVGLSVCCAESIEEGHADADTIFLDAGLPGADAFADRFSDEVVLMVFKGTSIHRTLRKPLHLTGLLKALKEKRASRSTTVESMESPAPPRVLNVLIAEDNAVNRRLARRMVEGMGHHVECVCDGLEAVEAVRCAVVDYDVILMDLHMPHMGGVEASSIISALPMPPPRTRPHIIALTADVTEAHNTHTHCLTRAGRAGAVRICRHC